MSEITVDFWMALSVIPMLIALGIYVWLSRRFDRATERDSSRYEELVKAVQAPLESASRRLGLGPQDFRRSHR